MLIFIGIVLGWIAIGFVANGLSGNILRILLMKKFNLQTVQEADQIAEARAYEVTGEVSDQKEHFFQLLLDDLIWPFCIYYAIKGYRKIKNERYKP